MNDGSNDRFKEGLSDGLLDCIYASDGFSEGLNDRSEDGLFVDFVGCIEPDSKVDGSCVGSNDDLFDGTMVGAANIDGETDLSGDWL